MTYDELGRIRGIGRESAVKLVQRRRWRRTRGNDGEARICVPPDWLTLAKSPSEEASPDHPPQSSPDKSPDIPRVMVALEAAIAAKDATIGALTVRAERAEAEADRLIVTVQSERERADKAEQGREAERTRADAVETHAAELRALLDAAEARATAIEKAEAERAARSRWRRLREALRRGG